MQSNRARPPPVRGASVRIATLGQFSIEVAGAPLRFDGKLPRKPLALLKTLVALGGRGVAVEHLCESIWPELDGDRAHSAFKSALSRLRKLIGGEALAQEGQRLSLDVGTCWVDALALVGQLQSALQAVDDRRFDAALELMDGAIGLYGGPFLDGEFDLPDVMSARERLHSQFVRHLGTVAEALCAHGDVADALRLYRMGLEVDDISEDFCRGLMHCCGRMGNVADALAAYRRFQHLLLARMGVEPSAELTGFYRELQAPESSAEASAGATPAGGLPAGSPPERTPAPGAGQPGMGTTGSHAAADDGERRSITVLEVRVPGLTGLLNTEDPEEAEAIIGRLRDVMTAVVERHGGVVNQFMHEEMVAFFGVPVAQEEHARSAALAALELCGPLGPQAGQGQGPADGWPRQAGLDTGLVVIKGSGNPNGRFAVTGAPLHRAALLARQARAGEVRVSAEIQRLVGAYFECQPPALPRGPPDASDAAEMGWRLLRGTAVQTRFEASALRGLTEFVGRQRELEDLRAALSTAAGGQGQFITVLGEAGIGKSRLVHEFRQGLDPSQHGMFQGRCQAAGENTPYLPWVEALRGWLGLDASTAPEGQVECLAAQVLALDPALERFVPVLLRLLSLQSARYPLPVALQGSDLQAAIREALGAVLTLSALQRPLLLVLEDWHWVDEASDGALQFLLGLVPTARLLVVVTRRPYGPGRWPQLSFHSQLALQPLDAQESARVARAALGARALPVGMEELVHERTGGNPLFIEEMLNHLMAEGTVLVKQGVALETSSAMAPHLPDTVQAVIRSRIDRLDADAREVLQMASVIGREFTLELVASVHPAPERLAAAIERLKGQELIRQLRVVPEADFQFNHVVTQTVVYETLLRERRRDLHAAVGRAIEASHAGRRPDGPVERLLHHFSLAEQWATAAEYARRSAQKAHALSQFEQAARLYTQGAEYLARLPAAEDTRGARADLQLEASFCQINLGWFDEAIAAGERIEADVQALADPVREVRLRVMLGTCAMYRGNREACERYLLPTLAMPALQGDDLTRANCKHVLAGCYVGQGLWNQAAPYLDEAVRIYERLGLEDEYIYGYFALPYVVGCAQLAIVRTFQGDVAAATALFRKGMPHALGPAANVATKGVFFSWLSVFSATVGDDRLNLQPVVEELVARAERSDSPFLLLAGRVLQSNLLLAQGRTEDARQLTADAVAVLGPKSIRTGHLANLYYNLVITELSKGDLETARRYLEDTRLLRKISPYWFGPRVDMLDGVLADLAGDPVRAHHFLEQSIADDEKVGAVLFADQTRYRQALVWARTGERERALRSLKELEARFAARDLPTWQRFCHRWVQRLEAPTTRRRPAGRPRLR